MVGGKRRLDALEQSLNKTKLDEDNLEATPLGDVSLLDDQDNDMDKLLAPAEFELSQSQQVLNNLLS